MGFLNLKFQHRVSVGLAAQEIVNSLRSNLAWPFLALFSSALTLASVARAQVYTESLISADNAYNPVPSPDGRYIAYVRTGWGRSHGSASAGQALFRM